MKSKFCARKSILWALIGSLANDNYYTNKKAKNMIIYIP